MYNDIVTHEHAIIKRKGAINIGSVKIDTSQKERSLDAKYPALDNPTGLRILLSDLHALQQRRYAGDTAASDILIDLATAIDRAGLTDRQRQAIDLVYGEDLTQRDAGERMGMTQQAVEQHLNNAIEAVTEVYYYWAGHNEGYGGIDV